MIYTVLRQRHMKEAVHLEEQLDRERQAKMAEARTEMADKRGHEREKLQAAFEQELLELVANPLGLSIQELNAQKEALKKKHKVLKNRGLFSITYESFLSNLTFGEFSYYIFIKIVTLSGTV